MNVTFFWEGGSDFTLTHKGNPYGPLLAIAMAELGITFVPGDYGFTRDWVDTNREHSDVLHINWLHHFYRGDTREESTTRLNNLADNLKYAKHLGYRIIWTFHNLYPHERPYPENDETAQTMMCGLADEIIAHCRYAEKCTELFGRKDRIHVIPHGNYIDAYPNEISKSEARTSLGIPQDALVYAFSGNARPYKGIERLVDAFRAVSRSDDHLLLMMKEFRFNAKYAHDYVELAANEPNITAVSSPYFEPHEFQTYLNAADVSVLPFVDVLTSGSAILSLSFGLPTILPALGCMPELIDETSGRLFDPSSPGSLAETLVQIREEDLTSVSIAAMNRARELDWDVIAGQISRLYGRP
jgi:glycosyltransferase involved in cell wall biosynthesis